MEFLKNSNWIWSPSWRQKDNETAKQVMFRRKIYLQEIPTVSKITISADTRYKLYINEKLIEVGPSKGDKQIWYADEMDISPYLQKGDNVIAILVLRYPEDPRKGNHSMARTSTPGLYMKGEIRTKNEQLDISADESWSCKIDNNFTIVPEEILFCPLMIHEEVTGSRENLGWMKADFNVEDWDTVKPYIRIEVPGSISPGNLNPRTIPFMYRKRRTFEQVYQLVQSTSSESIWNAFLKGEEKIVIPANRTEIVEIDAGEEMTGYLRLCMEGGAGATIENLQSEGYVQAELIGPAHVPKKGDRLDKENGHLDGYTDIYHVAGFGDGEQLECYEPFWFRTFRFIQLKITTGDMPLTLINFDYEETGYPLEVATKVETSDESLQAIWDISERTLRRCMHETYEDCPFYEQLQYVMDSRQQMLYTYSVSADDRLARQCMDDFRRSQRYDGLLNGSYPNCNPNVIPGFSLYYIFMIHDHMMYFGDQAFVREHMPTIERILNFFTSHFTEEGYVTKIGGENLEGPFWSFIDWAKEWNPTTGMPPAGLKGALTMESLLVVMAMQRTAELAAFLENSIQAEQYRTQAARLQDSIRNHCVSENGMLQDGPGVDDYSQQCQVFAILTDTVDMQIGRENLLKTIQNPEQYTQCTVAMRYYLFRALEKTDLYEYTNQYWDAWRTMIDNHCTTCLESEDYARSECHGWGALALFELPSIVLGVRPAEPGYQKVKIKPVPGYLEHARGTVKTPVGEVKVEWKKVDGVLKLEYEVPEGVEVIQ